MPQQPAAHFPLQAFCPNELPGNTQQLIQLQHSAAVSHSYFHSHASFLIESSMQSAPFTFLKLQSKQLLSVCKGARNDSNG